MGFPSDRLEGPASHVSWIHGQPAKACNTTDSQVSASSPWEKQLLLRFGGNTGLETRTSSWISFGCPHPHELRSSKARTSKSKTEASCFAKIEYCMSRSRVRTLDSYPCLDSNNTLPTIVMTTNHYLFTFLNPTNYDKKPPKDTQES